jgi:hypothetical protein
VFDEWEKSAAMPLYRSAVIRSASDFAGDLPSRAHHLRALDESSLFGAWVDLGSAWVAGRWKLNLWNFEL